jgi:hypothetical protein
MCGPARRFQGQRGHQRSGFAPGELALFLADGLVDQADLSGKFSTGGIQHSFALAAEYSWQKSSYGSFYANSAYTSLPLACVYGASGCSSANYLFTSLANPNPYDAYTGTIVKGPANSRTLANSSTASISIFDTITLSEKFLLNLGGRYDHYLTHASAALASPFGHAQLADPAGRPVHLSGGPGVQAHPQRQPLYLHLHLGGAAGASWRRAARTMRGRLQTATADRPNSLKPQKPPPMSGRQVEPVQQQPADAGRVPDPHHQRAHHRSRHQPAGLCGHQAGARRGTGLFGQYHARVERFGGYTYQPPRC